MAGSRGLDIAWLGQAGFRLVHGGLSIAIDPYLSDECATLYGLVRRQAAPVAADELGADAVLVTHWHEDHFDLPTISAALEGGSRVIAPPSVVARLDGRLGGTAAVTAIRPGESVAVGDARVTAVPADHAVAGFLTEDAVGFLVEIDGIRVYHSGDTAYSRDIVRSLPSLDVALVCINGSGGNMNVAEAASLAAQLDVTTVVPMHVGMWADDAYGAEATLDPERFAGLLRAWAPAVRVAVPSPGAEAFLRVEGGRG